MANQVRVIMVSVIVEEAILTFKKGKTDVQILKKRALPFAVAQKSEQSWAILRRTSRS